MIKNQNNYNKLTTNNQIRPFKKKTVNKLSKMINNSKNIDMMRPLRIEKKKLRYPLVFRIIML